MEQKLPERVEKHIPPGGALFCHDFVRPLLLVLQESWVNVDAQEFYVAGAVTMLLMLLDDPEARRRVLDNLTRTVGASFN